MEINSKLWKYEMRPFDPSQEVEHMECATKKEGILLQKPDISKKQSFMQFATKMSSKLISGGLNVLDLTLPAVMLHKETNVECNLRGFRVITSFLNEAAKIKDPISRIQLALTGCIANMTEAAKEMKAQAPIPSFNGETIQVNIPLNNPGCHV